MQTPLRLGTRGSALALWQAREVARLLRESGGPACEIVVIRTSGDETPRPFDPPPAPSSDVTQQGTTASTPGTPGTVGTSGTLSTKRLFVKEIEEALLEGRVDLAVHSAKDLPAELPDGLQIAAALPREDSRDALLLPATSAASGYDAVRQALGSRPLVGTSSVRRVAQLRRVFPGAEFRAIRGNVDTRLRKLDAGACDVLVLAAAGVNRLALSHRLSALLPIEVCLPAPGQGIVAVETARACPPALGEAIAAIADADAGTSLAAERAVVQALGAGCQVPLGALAILDGQDLTVRGVVAGPDGRVIQALVSGRRGGPVELGEKLAAALLAKGAREWL